MFATIAGPYPLPAGTAADALGAVLDDQLGAGLGMVGDGRVRRLDTDEDVAAAVEAWMTASAALTELVGEGPAPALKACWRGTLISPRTHIFQKQSF